MALLVLQNFFRTFFSITLGKFSQLFARKVISVIKLNIVSFCRYIVIHHFVNDVETHRSETTTHLYVCSLIWIRFWAQFLRLELLRFGSVSDIAVLSASYTVYVFRFKHEYES